MSDTVSLIEVQKRTRQSSGENEASRAEVPGSNPGRDEKKFSKKLEDASEEEPKLTTVVG